MRVGKLEEMTKGWFIGNFEPSLLKTDDVEIAVKKYHEADHEIAHYHKIAKEFTVVISGCVRMFDQEFAEGDIIIAEPGDITDFTALTDTVSVVVKIPGANNDKYMADQELID